MFKKAIFILILGSFIGSCDVLQSNDDSKSDSASGLIKTDLVHVEAVVLTDPHKKVVFDIPFEIRNTMPVEIYMVGCKQAPPPVLQKLVLGEWVDVYSQVVLQCLSPPFIIKPGDTFSDTLRVEGYAPGQNIYPTFEVEVDGTYRLIQKLYMNLDNFDTRKMEGGLLPIDVRTSKPFKVERK